MAVVCPQLESWGYQDSLMQHHALTSGASRSSGNSSVGVTNPGIYAGVTEIS